MPAPDSVMSAAKRAPKSVPKVPAHGRAPEAAPVGRNRAAYAVGVLVFATTLALVASLFVAADRERPVPEKRRGPGIVAAPGLVESISGLLSLAFEIPGKLKTVRVEEGQRVKAGEVLAELANAAQAANAALARADLKVAQAELLALEGDLTGQERQAERAVERAAAEWAMLKAGPRSEELEHARALARAAAAEWKRRLDDARRYVDPKIASEQQRDLSQGEADVAEAQLAAARAKLRELEAGFRPQEIEKAHALHEAAKADLERLRATRDRRLEAAAGRVEQARAKLAAAETELAKTTLSAPHDGVVIWKYRHAGESVGVLPPEPILAVADPRKVRVRADVDEGDYARIRPGTSARVRAEAFGDRDFLGRVTLVGAAAGRKRFSSGEAKERQDVKIVETLIEFEAPPPFKLGLRVTVQFEGVTHE
ncbi:MAG: hypothetical protein AMXMBFR7_40850 [Planctomycetota bacterium]